MQGAKSGTSVEGLQRCFCMDIQRSKIDSTKANTTHNWIGHYYTTNTSSQIHIKSKLCYNNQTRYR
jgi:hypothetical protein